MQKPHLALLFLLSWPLLVASCGQGEMTQDPDSKGLNSGPPVIEVTQKDPASQLAEGMGELNVHVELRDDGTPVEGILVRLLWQTDQNDTGRVFRKTDANGDCSFEVAGGTVISSLSVEPTANTAPAWMSIKRPIIAGKIVDINFELVPGGILSGMAINADGQPAAGATLQVWYSKHGELERNPVEEPDATAKAGPDGVFTIGGMPQGDFVLSATAEGLVCTRRVGGHINEAQILDGFELFLEPAHSLMGTVRNNKGQGIENVLVVAGMVGRHAKRDESIHDECWYFPAKQWIGYSSKEGDFTIPAIPSSQVWVLEAKHKEYQNLRNRLLPGETIVDLELIGGVSLSGIIVDEEGQPVAKARMLLDGEQSRERKCQNNGKFLFSGLVEDWDAQLAVHKPGFAPALVSGLKIAPESPGMEVQLQKGNMLEGKLLSPNGEALQGLRIRVVDNPALSKFGLESTVSGPDGGFFLTDLPAQRLEWVILRGNQEIHRFSWAPADGAIELKLAG